MSYAIVFQTLMVEKNNRIYHFSRCGCNNDDCGRKADDFTLKIYENKEEALNDIKRFENDFEDILKINNKMVYFDYYYHYLKKKIEKPLSYEKFKSDYCSGFSQLVEIICKNNNRTYKPNNFNKIYYDLLKEFGSISLKYHYDNNIQFDDLTNEMQNLRIYIKKYKKYKK